MQRQEEGALGVYSHEEKQIRSRFEADSKLFLPSTRFVSALCEGEIGGRSESRDIATARSHVDPEAHLQLC
jgi:hypothetical protein